MNKNINRLIYTSRINDIVGSIKKQKNDIENILRDTREVQKAINTLDGQLGRQFTVTDEMLFKVIFKITINICGQHNLFFIFRPQSVTSTQKKLTSS